MDNIKLPKYVIDSINYGIKNHFINNYNGRGIGLITDKQLVFYSQKEDEAYETHDGIEYKLNGYMFPNYKKNYNELKINSSSDFLVIYINELTKEKKDMLIYFLNEVFEIANNHKLQVSILNNKSGAKFVSYNYDEIKEYINEINISNNYMNDNENIIGYCYDEINLKNKNK